MRRGLVAGSFSLLAAAVIVAVPAATLPARRSAGGGTRAIPAGGTTSIRGSAPGPDGLQQPELRPGGGEDEPGAFNRPRPGFKNGKFPKKPLDAAKVASSLIATTNPDVVALAERPDPPRPAAGQRRQPVLARAARPGALRRQRLRGRGREQRAPGAQRRDRRRADRRRRTSTRSSATRPRSTGRPGPIGPEVIDPVCHYDPDNNRFMVVITTLFTSTPTATSTGRTRSTSPCPTPAIRPGLWTIYHVPAQNDGTDGTPNHGCTLDGVAARSVLPGLPAHRRRPQRRLRDDERVRPVRAELQRRAGLRLLEGAAGRPPGVDQRDAGPEPQRRRLARLHGVAGHLARRASTRARRNGTEYLLSTIAGDGSETGNPTGHRPPDRHVGASPTPRR